MTSVYAPPDRAEYPATNEAELTSGENRLVVQQALFAAADTIFKIFLGLYLFDIGGVWTVTVFFCLRYTFMTIGFVAFGKLLAQMSSNAIMRSSMLMMCGVYVALIALGSDALLWVAVLGAVAGLAEGFYWPGLTIAELISTRRASRNLFFGKCQLWFQISSASAPPIAGIIFTVTQLFGSSTAGYHVLFGLLIVVLLITRHQMKSLADWKGPSYRFRNSLRRPDSKEWSLVLLQHAFSGASTTAVAMFAPILAIQVIQTELNVSIFSAVMAVVGGVASGIAGRALHRWARSYWVGVVAVPLGLVTLAVWPGWLGLMGLVFLVTAGGMFTFTAMRKSACDAMERAPMGWERNYHRVVEKEAALNAGRILSFVAVAAMLPQLDQLEAVRWGLVIVAPIALLAGLCQVGLNRCEPLAVQVHANRIAKVTSG